MTNFYESRISTLEIDDTGGTQRDLTAYLVSVDFSLVRNLIDVTALGDTGRKSIPGLQQSRFTAEFHWSEDADVGPDTVLGPVAVHTASVDFEYGPEGNASGDIMYTGKCFVEDWRITSRVGTEITGAATFLVDGATTRAAHA